MNESKSHDTRRTEALYEVYDEEERLNHTKAGSIEFLTTLHYIKRYVKPGQKILDIGAGTGAYSLYLAEQGYSMTAVDLVAKHVEIMQQKADPAWPLTIRQGNATDLSFFADHSFDAVLLLGPLYHLREKEDRAKAMAEAKRVLKDDGALFIGFIPNDVVLLREFFFDPAFLTGDSYDHDTFRLADDPFVFFTVEQCRHMLKENGVDIVHEVAADGLAEIFAEKINALDEEGFLQYLKLHFYLCEKPEMLGHSHHLLYVGKKSWKQGFYKRLEDALDKWDRIKEERAKEKEERDKHASPVSGETPGRK
ncbi:MAG: methyltransferase domain-containing protein [Tissierellia bacterium]|jgi:ubiquinone/menaquinone biosynthesis C-methylase UbiE|nr:methyltransferase domain-containing protein [Bacillota bacterium]NLK58203.1 methyltransferase domain-containing protein [Tissierellia bacterium]